MKWCRVYAAVGALATAVCFVLPSGAPKAAGYFAVGASSVWAVIVGVLRHRPASKAAWLLTAGGLACWTVADVLYIYHDEILGVSPFPSSADVLYLGAYAFLALGLYVMVRRRRGGRRDSAGLIDSAIVTVTLTLLSWVVLAGPIARAPGDSVLIRLVGVAYPAADILLLALLVRLLNVPGSRKAAFRLLMTAMSMTLAADYIFALLALKPDFSVDFLDMAFLMTYVVWGTAALHPSMTSLTTSGDDAVVPFTRRRLVTLTVAVLVAPLTPAVQGWFGQTPDVAAVVLASSVLFGLVVARMDAAITAATNSSRQRDLLADSLAHQSAHDPLTQLTNRARALELIEAALHRATRSGTMVGLLFVDLDNFKRINDTHGHRTGDEALREAAARVTALVHAGDTVGRLGGDEFVVLVEPVASESSLVALADRVVGALAEPMRIGTREVVTGASVGVAINRDGGTDASALLHDADVAAYRAKAAGRGRAEVFDDALRRELQERASLEAALRRAMVHGELRLFYQPVVRLGTGAVCGYEALVRWERPGHGLVPPDSFIPAAERSTLIHDLDRWVLREATRQLREWSDADPDRFGDQSIAVNISGRHLAHESIVGDVVEALADSGLDAGRLHLEITETMLVDDVNVPVHLEALREIGVRVSIDDFGTGYTSIGQLQHMHADILKIDKSLVGSTSAGGAELLRLVIKAAHAFGLQVVGEGVENPHQIAFLLDEGCDFAQGYHFSPPRPPECLRKSPAGPPASASASAPAPLPLSAPLPLQRSTPLP